MSDEAKQARRAGRDAPLRRRPGPEVRHGEATASPVAPGVSEESSVTQADALALAEASTQHDPQPSRPETSPLAAPTPAALLVRDALDRLARSRPIFHAEADLQHALAWELRAYGEKIRLEVRPLPDEALFLDLLVNGPLGRIAVELKYVTRAHRAEVDGEVYSLREQSAHDLRRYDVVRDLERLERLLSAGVADHGVAVVLTNAAALWAPAAPRSTCDRGFRIHEGATLAGALEWAPGTGAGTRKNREKALVLRGRYRMSWFDYSKVGTGPGSTFRALVVSVGTRGRGSAARR